MQPEEVVVKESPGNPGGKSACPVFSSEGCAIEN